MPVLWLQGCHSSIYPVLTPQWGSKMPRRALPQETRTGEFPQLFPSGGLCMSTSSSPEDSRVVVLPPWPLLSPYHKEVTVISQYNHIIGSREVLQRITHHGVCPGWLTPHRLGSGNQPSVKEQGWCFACFCFFETGLCQAQASLLPQPRARTTS